MSAATPTASASLASPHSDELYVNLPLCWDTLSNDVKRSMVGWVQIIDAETTECPLLPGQILSIVSDNTKSTEIDGSSDVHFELEVNAESFTFKNIMLPSVKGDEVDVGCKKEFSEGFHIIIPNCTTTVVVHKLELTIVDDNSDDKEYNAWAQEDFIMTNTELGAGGQGSVCLGFDISTSKRIAIKTIFGNYQGMVLPEVDILSSLGGHPYFIQLIDAHATSQAMYIVLQHAWGDLSRYIDLHVTVPEECAKEIFKQLLKGIKIMHDKNLVHRDIKPGNILLLEFSRSPTAVYADFGLTKKLTPSAPLITSFAGTRVYMAPEVFTTLSSWDRVKSEVVCGDSDLESVLDLPSFTQDGYGKPSDMWSLGIVLFQMLFGELPFGMAGTYSSQLSSILSMNVSNSNQQGQVTNECMELIRNLLIVDSDERYTIEDALACAWIAEPAVEEAIPPVEPAVEEASPPAPPLQQSRKRDRRMPSPSTRTHYPRDAKRANINYKW
ncbi:kinase-like domain-containing protein [Syncephalis plumigaleata]|nr:kinase-like domain-containing protein [Syncephalis plumigaleata]